MDQHKYSPTITQANETSYRTINYSNINTLSFVPKQNKYSLETNRANQCQKLSYHLTTYRSSMNNKKNFLLDEDDTKNNENFQIFLDNLLKKEESPTNLDKKNFRSDENPSIYSNKKFFLEKINANNYKYDINNNKKEEEKYYSFRDNKKIKNKIKTKKNNNYFQLKYKLKNFLFSIPKKSKKQIIYNDDINYKPKDNNEKYFDSTNDILQSFQIEKKNIGIDCKINDYNFNKTKKRNNTSNNNLAKLTQTFSFKQFDGEMLNNLIELGKVNKKTKKIKNNSFNHINKYVPEYKVPKIIFYSGNKSDKKDKITEQKLNTMKENAIHFLKDNKYNIISANSYKNKKININNSDYNSIYSKEILNPFEKIKLIYGNGKNLIPYLQNFDKSYRKKIKKKKLNINNKKNIFSTLKNKNKNKNYSNINIKCIYNVF